MTKNYPLPTVYNHNIIALTITLVLLAIPLIVTMGCSPTENAQAMEAESVKSEELISLQDINQAIQALQEGQETVAITDIDIEMIEQSARLANEESKKAFSLINSLKKHFVPSGNQLGLPLRFVQDYVSPSPNKNKNLMKAPRRKSDIIRRASKIAQNVEGVGKSDPFAPPREMAQFHPVSGGGLLNLIATNITNPKVVSPKVLSRSEPIRLPNQRQSNVVKRKSTAIQLRGIAISNQSAAMLEIYGTAHIVSQGDVVAGMKVIEIREDGIVLDKSGKKYNLTLSQ